MSIAAEQGGAAFVARATGLRARMHVLTSAERNRVFLWVPVFLGAGVGTYFALPVEPVSWIAPAAFGGCALLAVAFRHIFGLRLALAAVALLAGGVALADWRTEQVRAPVLADGVGPTTVSGRVVWAGAGEGQQRYLLEQVTIAGLADDETPARVRISVRSAPEAPVLPGAWVALRAKLRPPPPPSEPGAWDFARQAWFQRIGAVGFAFGAPERVETPPGEGGGFVAWVSSIRHDISARVLAQSSESAGPMATALLTGDRSAIPDSLLSAMRDSGLAHLLAISGLHIGLVAGLVFFALRGLLALIEPVALRFPIKKWAAAGALIGAGAYLLLSGMSVPTQRAFVMVAFVLIAVMLDRASLSMRLIAWAALVVLVIAPESLLGPSFQMSFAAATALIATYEAARRPFARLAARGGKLYRPFVYAASVSLTSLVAGIATGPFAVYHFNRIADYGLLANLGAVPITAFWVMPWGLVALILAPFGLEWLALVPMGWGIDGIAWVASSTAALPGAVSLIPAMPTEALVLIALGGLWLCIWRPRWRFYGLAGIAAGILLTALAQRPDILVDGEARVIAVRGQDGALWLSTRQRGRFASDLWLRRDGQANARRWPDDAVTEHPSGLRCDAIGCVQQRDHRVIALVDDPRAFAEDCARADVVISVVPAWDLCRGPTTIVDRFDLWREGSHAIWLDEDPIRTQSVAAARGDRPWVLKRGAGGRLPAAQ